MTGFLYPEYLVSTHWLAAHLDDPAVVILDCTTHLIPNPTITYDIVPGRADFEKGHIKGAQFCDVSSDVSDTAHRFRFMRQSPALKISQCPTPLTTIYHQLCHVAGFEKMALEGRIWGRLS